MIFGQALLLLSSMGLRGVLGWYPPMALAGRTQSPVRPVKRKMQAARS